MTIKNFTAVVLAILLFSEFTFAQDGLQDLENLSLENLGNIVTSVSKKPEDSFRSPAAIYVITNEDIKLSGATHIAEILRSVPGLNVAHIDSSNWAVSSRGFNDLFANKLLVLVDGRTIYTPLFSGVYWDIQNLPMEDIERIEVIRGPGAALWGANAVNGIINIITKNASDTQGLFASTIVGDEDKTLSNLRYGGNLGEDLYYRAYAMYEKRDSTRTATGDDGGNEWDLVKGGFRSDWKVSDTRKITLQGDVYNSDIDLDLNLPSLSEPSGIEFREDTIRSRGFNVLGRWSEQHSDTLQSTFQAYVDNQSPDYSSLQQELTTFDLDYQTEWKATARHNVLWGLGSRMVRSSMVGSSDITIARDTNSYDIASAFAQDQYALVVDKLYLTLGSKFEENSYSDFEVEPSARLAWHIDSRQTAWAAISRAVRTPSIVERSLTINVLSIAPGVIAQQQSSENFTSEDLIAYEVGYRVKPTQTVMVDTTAFVNDYTNLATFEPNDPIFTPEGGVIVPYRLANLGEGYTYGSETSISWDVTSRWNLLANYTYFNMVLSPGDSLDPLFEGQEGKTPHHQATLRSELFLPADVRLVNAGYYVSRLKFLDITDYFRFDSQIIWQLTPSLEFAFVGQNLLQAGHQEFGAPLNGTVNELPRSFYGRLSARF